MKKYKFTFFTPLLLILLLLQGCMPDSLTKFKKDPPKKPVAASTSSAPVTDDTGNVINFDPPTKFYFISETNPTGNMKAFEFNYNIIAVTDGTLADTTLRSKFFERCDLVLTGNAQTTSLPAGLSFHTSFCSFMGTPTAIKSVTSAFCSDSSYLTEAACISAPLTWNSLTSTCSNPDVAYSTQSACLAGFNKWYAVGDPVPYRVKMTYHNAQNVVKYIYTTVNLRSLISLTQLTYSQNDKILLDVALKSAGNYSDIVPLLTTTSTAGAYARANTMIDSNGVVGVAKLVDTSKNKIGVNKLVAIKVGSTLPFTQYGFISKVGDATKVGKIFSINSSKKTLYVENISANNKYFVAGDTITTNATGVGTAYTITEIDDSYIINAASLDNDSQYFSDEYGVSNKTNIYEVGYSIKPIGPLTTTEINSSNGITYTISPALPCEDPADVTKCVSIDSSTGIISGTFPSALASTAYTVTAANAVSSVTHTFQLGAINSVKDLSITNKQVITVNTTANFKEGEYIYQPITPPLTDAPSAKIIKILNSHKLAIETFNGDFLQNTSLDNGNAYLSEKAFIIPDNSCSDINYSTQATCEAASEGWSPGPVYYNVALKLNTTGQYTPTTSLSTVYATATAGTGLGAKALVSGVFTDTIGGKDIIFLQYLTNTGTSLATSKVFYQGDVLDSTSTVLFVLNDTLKVGVASSASFNLGVDVTSNGNAGAYNYKQGTNILYLSDLTFKPAGTDFAVGNVLYNDETQSISTANTNITSVTHDIFYIAERGTKVVFPAFLSSGNEVIYSISPALPSGLSLNTKTGVISGSSTYSSARKEYILTASNFIGSAKFIFALEVRDYFKLENATTAPTFLLHKVGDSQINRKCRVNATDILGATTDLRALDIRCFMDVEEQDLYQIKMKLKETAGPGVCQFVSYTPVYFDKFAPYQSTRVSGKYPEKLTVRTGCATLNLPPTPDMCDGNYSSIDSTYPDCDEGYLEYTSEVWGDPGGGGCALASTSTVKVNCGGTRAKCIAGPVKDIFTDQELKDGKRTVIAEASGGYTKTFEHASPLERALRTNLWTANGMVKNKCTSSNDHVNSWETSVTNTRGPFYGNNPFYEFNCLDAAQEIKARIRLIVRDWNKSFRISDSIDTQSYTAPAPNMNIATLDPFGSSYNDRYDWDDNYSFNIAGAANYSGATTALSCGNQVTAPCTTDPSVITTQGTCTSLGGSSWTGVCSNPAFNSSYTNCIGGGATWTSGGCVYNDQARCEFYGGTWSGDPGFVYPEEKL